MRPDEGLATMMGYFDATCTVGLVIFHNLPHAGWAFDSPLTTCRMGV